MLLETISRLLSLAKVPPRRPRDRAEGMTPMPLAAHVISESCSRGLAGPRMRPPLCRPRAAGVQNRWRAPRKRDGTADKRAASGVPSAIERDGSQGNSRFVLLYTIGASLRRGRPGSMQAGRSRPRPWTPQLGGKAAVPGDHCRVGLRPYKTFTRLTPNACWTSTISLDPSRAG